ncbi:MAG TPA: glycosyltransferase family 2 protein [Anaerolineales bacterium]|nr:glycosyltransferase family 2 protein [Anaerolineales bacterium]
MRSEVCTIIVNWNLRADTVECLRSLFAAGVPPGGVVVVDNGSTDGSVDAVRAEFGGKLDLIETGKNLGLAGGINSGLPAVLAGETDWVFLLNNDTIVEPDLFERFADAVHAAPGIAVWGPRIVYHADPGRVWFLAERRIGRSLLGRPVPETRLEPEDAPLAVRADFISGCAMLVRREVFERIGGFDESLFLFAEEVDFCLRAARAGFKLAAAPRAGVRHKVSLSTDRDKPTARFLRIRNQVRVYRRYASVPGRGFYFLFTLLRALYHIAGDLLRGDGDLAGQTFRGWLAGWFTRAGPRNR